MRKIKFIIIFLLFLPTTTGFAFFIKVPVPVEGVYFLKNKTLTYFDLVSRDNELRVNLAELTDSKPDFLKIDVADYDKLNAPQFGSFQFGNNGKKIWFLMGKDGKGFWSDFYIDQNLDYTIIAKEKVKAFQTFNSKDHGFEIAEASSLIPISLKVSYKGISKEFEEKLYFFIFTAIYSKNNAAETIVKAVTASFFDGQMKMRIGKDEKSLKYRILDANGNGCYNDYNVDLIYVDLNNDGFYSKNEGQRLQEFYSFKDSNKEKRQLHMILLSFPLKVAVSDVSQDFDLSELEPQDPEDAKAGVPDDHSPQASSVNSDES